MGNSSDLGIVVFAILSGIIALFYFKFLISLDKSRIRSKINSSGGKVIKISWTLFGSGWFGEKGERRYKVKYMLSNGRVEDATCKTSMLSGVYWTSSDIPQFSKNDRLNKKCNSCGNSLEKQWNFCPNCGVSSIEKTERIRIDCAKPQSYPVVGQAR